MPCRVRRGARMGNPKWMHSQAMPKEQPRLLQSPSAYRRSSPPPQACLGCWGLFLKHGHVGTTHTSLGTWHTSLYCIQCSSPCQPGPAPVRIPAPHEAFTPCPRVDSSLRRLSWSACSIRCFLNSSLTWKHPDIHKGMGHGPWRLLQALPQALQALYPSSLSGKIPLSHRGSPALRDQGHPSRS